MANYSKLLQQLQSLIGEDASEDNIFRQASNAIEHLLAQQGLQIQVLQPEEPTDHEAEGAMLYVMSRGK